VADWGLRAVTNAERTVRDMLARHGSVAFLADAVLLPVSGGLSNHAWCAHREGESWFIRLSPVDSEQLGVDRRGECALLDCVAAAGIAPPLVLCDPQRQLLVTRYIDGLPWSREQALNKKNIESIAGLLAGLHALPVPSAVPQVSFPAQARRLTHLLEQRGEAVAAQLQVRACAVEGRLNLAAVAPVLCHNDLHHLNIIADGHRLWIVDWEYGGSGDAMFDLASFLCQHGCGDVEREYLVRAYHAGGRCLEESRLEAACWYFNYVQWLWYRVAAKQLDGESCSYAQRASDLLCELQR